MRIAMAVIVSLSMLMIQRVATSQPGLYGAGRLAEPDTAASQQETMIFKVQYYPVEQLMEILRSLSVEGLTTIVPDPRTNALIVRTTPQRMATIRALVSELDVPRVSQSASSYMACRVFMLEVPSRNQNARPFTVALKTAGGVSAQSMSQAMEDEDLQIRQLVQGETGDGSTYPVRIEGLAASEEAVRRMIGKVPSSILTELKWGDQPFAGVVPVAQFSQLPEQLRQHLRKFLGDDLQTIAYWFGNLSFPGELTAPIGPWSLHLAARTAQAGDLHMEIEVGQPQQGGAESPVMILSNSLDGKIGKPIIIGYNRESYGTRTMGALVIIPEADTQPAETQPKASR